MSSNFPFLSRMIETETIGDSLRARTAGDFVRLDDGFTHY